MVHHYGTIEVITGSMFCGKTDELIRRLRRATIARQKVQVLSQKSITATAPAKSPHMLAANMMQSR